MWSFQEIVLREVMQRGCDNASGSHRTCIPDIHVSEERSNLEMGCWFRKLNQTLRRCDFPLQQIQNVLHKRPGYRNVTQIDLSMCNYTFELDNVSKELWVIITPCSEFWFKLLPMGVLQTPDLCQEITESIIHDMPTVDVFWDDILGIFTN